MLSRNKIKKDFLKKDTKVSILIIKPGAIGDVLQMTPVVRAIKRNLPNVNVIFLVGSQVTSKLLYYNPYIGEVFIFQKSKGIGEIGRIFRLSRSLKKKGIDLILNYQPSNWRWRILTCILKPKNVFLYKKQKKVKKSERIRHAVNDHLFTLSQLGIMEEDLHLDIFLTDQEIKEAKALINNYVHGSKSKGTVCLNMGASHPVNRWPVNFFYKLDSILTSEGFKTIIIGGPEDRILVDHFLHNGPSRCLDLVGKLSIRETAAVLSQCDVLVSGDTGPLHLATSVSTKVIGLFGAADPERTGPIGSGNIVIQSDLPCVPCRKRYCPNEQRSCMEDIKPELVTSKIYEILSND